MLDLVAGDTRVFLFHSPGAAGAADGAMDKVNEWLGRDRTNARYPNLRIKDISIASDGQGGVYTLIVCNLGEKNANATGGA